MKTIEKTTVESVSVEEGAQSVDVEDGLSVDAAGLHDTLEDLADGFDVEGFKCVKCGLVHEHDTTKHQLSMDGAFDADDDIATEMDYNSVCHCGLQEAARRGSDFGIDEDKASRRAGNAPIPDDARREMNALYGAS